MMIYRRLHSPRAFPQDYQYPAHLREQVTPLPNTAGVYLFWGEDTSVPLYIGKSVNIRTRVLSHLRTEDEDYLLRQIRKIDYRETAGDIGAQLLEASLIKTMQPLFNKKLRRTRRLYSLAWKNGTISVVNSAQIDFATDGHIYGLFGSKTAAQEQLRVYADEFRLCHGVLGLEAIGKDRGCFRSMLNRCAGVCCGRETREAHEQRLLQALEQIRVAAWPFPRAVALQERRKGFSQYHVLHNWYYLGSATTLANARKLDRVAPGFDEDSYRILLRPVLGDQHRIVLLN